MSNLPASSMTPSQIRRRANDYDSQIRQGLEEGNVRQVVKGLGADLMELLALRQRGTQEQVAAFPRPLFLYQFIRAWNKSQSHPKFVEQQLEAMERFDAEQAAGSRPFPRMTPVNAALPAASQVPARSKVPTAPAKPSTPPPRAGPSQSVPARVIKPRLPSTSPSPPPTTRPPARPATQRGDRDIVQRRKVEVVVPPPAPQKFQEIEASGDEYEPSPSPPPPTQRSVPQSGHNIKTIVVFTRACDRCKRGNRDCEVEELGTACVGCKARKYGCDKTGMTQEKTMTVTRPASDSESEVEVSEVRKGKKRQATSPVPPKTKPKKVKVKVEKEEKEKSRSKGKARQRAPPKSAPEVFDTGDEEDPMEVDEEESVVKVKAKPKPSRARKEKDDHGQRIAMLEEQFSAFKKVAEETTRTSKRVDNIESSVNRFAGSLENFLSRIQIDNRLRLVPDTRLIEGSPSPIPEVTRSASPFTPLEIPIELDDADLGSSAPDTRTTPSDSHGETRMQAPAPVPTPVPAPAPAVPPPQGASLDTSSSLPAVPTINMVPATPQGPSLASSHLGVPEGRITRSRSRSKTPI